MPKSYLNSQLPPDVYFDDWLTWSVLKLELIITNVGCKIPDDIGINKTGDLQHIIMPIVVLKALGDAIVVLGNSIDLNSKRSLIYVDMTDLGFMSVIKTFSPEYSRLTLLLIPYHHV